MKLYLFQNFDRKLLPVPAARRKNWWQDNDKTRDHAKHCLPLTMANSLGFYILSPLTFAVEWDGDVCASARIEVLERSTHGSVDDHAAYGSFTVQPGFLPMTDKPGEFIFVKGIPNERGFPYNCMEAIIEAWWNPATFGLVFLLNRAGRFVVQLGQPIAQMFAFRCDNCGVNDLQIVDEIPDEYQLWERKRNRPEYAKDLDYMRGHHPDGRPEPTHVCTWREIDRVGTQDSSGSRSLNSQVEEEKVGQTEIQE